MRSRAGVGLRPKKFKAGTAVLGSLILPNGVAADRTEDRRRSDLSGNKRQTVEIQVTHVGPDLQFATAEVAKSTAKGLGSSSDGPSAASSAEEKQSA